MRFAIWLVAGPLLLIFVVLADGYKVRFVVRFAAHHRFGFKLIQKTMYAALRPPPFVGKKPFRMSKLATFKLNSSASYAHAPWLEGGLEKHPVPRLVRRERLLRSDCRMIHDAAR